VRRDLDRLTAVTFDLLVIGGGIHGLAAAYDAAQRGLSVALVEREDFGSGASFNNLRTVHGGLRSLQTGDLGKFRLSIRERRTFARIAPHLVEPLAFLLPTTRKLTRSRPALAIAFQIDALLGADRNRDLPPRLHLPRGRTLSRAECLAVDPLLAAHADAITGGALWYDYQMPRTERLTLAFAHAAAEAGGGAQTGRGAGARAGAGAGAALANYVEAERALIDGGRVIGAGLRDLVSGETFEIRARTLLNAAGAGLPALLATSNPALTRTRPLPLQKAINLVTTRPMGHTAIAGSHGGGTLIRTPWRGRAIIGTWHSSAADAAATVDVTREEVDRVITDINATFPGLTLDREEVTLVHRGLVPAHADRTGAVQMQSESRILDHASDGVTGLISIRGAKYTTARAVAESAIDLIERHLGRAPTRCRTAETPLPGAPPVCELPGYAGDGGLVEELCHTHPHVTAACAEHLAFAYGTRCVDVLALASEMPSLANPIDPAHPAIGAEVLYAVREEMALTLTDVVTRRIQLGVAGHPGDRAAQCCAAIMQDECGWSDARTAQELQALRDFYRPL
jgi:glycerol-3-phosphate dehydrogenase